MKCPRSFQYRAIYEVNIANAQEVGIAAFYAAVLYEMTFFGFDEEAVDAERQKLYDSFREAEELDKLPPEERAKHFFSAEEVFAELGIPEPSEEERQETHRQMCREMLINSLRTYRMLEKYMKTHWTEEAIGYLPMAFSVRQTWFVSHCVMFPKMFV